MENTLTAPREADRPAVAQPSTPRAAMSALDIPLTIDVRTTIAVMRARGHEHLIHYAGAAHRDLVAWHFCAAYLADPSASEWTLKSRALKAAHDWDVAPEQLRAAGAS